MMSGVWGDVIDLSPLRTTIIEIGSPGAGEDSDVWVRARQYTGRVVTVSNKSFFDEPIYNYCRGFDYIWEEIGIPLTYTTDWERGKAILLEEGGEATRDRGRVLVVVQDLSEGRRVEANQQRFLANAAHELRTPLTATVGAAELLLNEEKKTPNCDVAS